jgi:hypothetical protein
MYFEIAQACDSEIMPLFRLHVKENWGRKNACPFIV